jgi:hypothetical protein
VEHGDLQIGHESFCTLIELEDRYGFFISYFSTIVFARDGSRSVHEVGLGESLLKKPVSD